MPSRNINLTPQLDSFVESRIQAGQYANASEVLRARLRALEQSEIADGDVLAEVRERIRRRALVLERA